MRISDWSSYVCSSDLRDRVFAHRLAGPGGSALSAADDDGGSCAAGRVHAGQDGAGVIGRRHRRGDGRAEDIAGALSGVAEARAQQDSESVGQGKRGVLTVDHGRRRITNKTTYK